MEKINFSIPVNLFDYRESDNSLYSYAKLKIFYVGQTGDKRIFTKKFSDELLKTLPYVPVVGYYDEEDEDFKGHHREVQHIYGIVPEDTEIEYIFENGKEYAVCDVILYTGRNDRTGEIAQKIVGKPHSLELDPKTTTYEINRDGNGNVKNIEFKTGNLLGLSILGDNERPAFSGSGFFTQDSEFLKLFEGFKTELERFTATKQRGENMIVDTSTLIDSTEGIETVENTVIFTSEEGVEEAELQTDDTLENVEDTEIDVEEGDVEADVETTDAEEIPEIDEIEEEFDEVLTREQRFAEAFMRVTYDEVAEEVLSAFYTEYGQDVYVVQWSPFDNILVYLELNEWKYYRLGFSQGEEGAITFGEKVGVKPRYLTEEEIDTIFIEATNEEEIVTEEETESGIEELDEDSSNDNGVDDGDAEQEEFEKNEKSEKELNSTALNNSEREELEAFREAKKEELINSFEDDLSSDFIEKLRSKIREYNFDKLEIELSKEYTRVSRQDRNITKPNTFVYVGNTSENLTEAQKLKNLVDQYKTKK